MRRAPAVLVAVVLVAGLGRACALRSDVLPPPDRHDVRLGRDRELQTEGAEKASGYREAVTDLASYLAASSEDSANSGLESSWISSAVNVHFRSEARTSVEAWVSYAEPADNQFVTVPSDLLRPLVASARALRRQLEREGMLPAPLSF